MKGIITALILLIAFEGTAQPKYTFVFLHTKKDAPQLSKEESSKLMEGHMANIVKMHKEGHLAAAGPFEGGGGMAIFNSTSTKEIEEWMSPDPGMKANRWNIEMLPYEPKIGGVCDAPEPYEMVLYTFIQFKPKIYKFNLQEASETVEQHNKFVKELAKGGNVITHGLFGSLDGAILVMKGDVQQEVILQDPAVVGALFDAEFTKLYVAKGSFCESK
jgi:uncharacterized protein YciI